MRIKLIALGNRMPGWVSQGFGDYAKRLPHDYRLELLEVPLQKCGKTTDQKRCIEKETKAMLAKIEAIDFVIGLDKGGQQWGTRELTSKLSEWHDEGRPIALLIGGPTGLSHACLQQAHAVWSLAKLTFPHPLVRIIVAEQIYRAWSILQGHPYHK